MGSMPKLFNKLRPKITNVYEFQKRRIINIPIASNPIIKRSKGEKSFNWSNGDFIPSKDLALHSFQMHHIRQRGMAF